MWRWETNEPLVNLTTCWSENELKPVQCRKNTHMQNMANHYVRSTTNNIIQKFINLKCFDFLPWGSPVLQLFPLSSPTYSSVTGRMTMPLCYVNPKGSNWCFEYLAVTVALTPVWRPLGYLFCRAH